MPSSYPFPVTLATTDVKDFDEQAHAACEALKVLHGSALGTPVANYFYHDSATNALKKRNAANSADVTLVPNTEAANGGLLPTSGGTLSGNLAMGGNKVTGLGAATANGEALRYEDMTRLEKQHITFLNSDGMPSGPAATVEIVGFTPNVAITVVGVKVVFNLGATYGGTNYHTLRIRNKGTGGAGTTDLATKSLQSTTVTAYASIDFGAISNANVAAGETLVLRIENTATDPALLTGARALVTVYYKIQ